MQQRQLAERVAAPQQPDQRLRRPLGDDFEPAGADHVEALGVLALAEEPLAGPHGHLTGLGRELLEQLVGEPGEHGGAAEHLGARHQASAAASRATAQRLIRCTDWSTASASPGEGRGSA